MQIGYIKLHRQLLEWEWYDDINVFRLFTHILLKSNYEPKYWHGIFIDIGQFLTSREKLAKQTCLTEQQVRSALTKLKSTSEITIKTTSNYTLITVTNWDKWQQNNQQSTEQATSNQPTNNQRITTTKEDKKERKEEEATLYNEKNDFQKIYEFGAKLFPRLASANTSAIHQWITNGCDVELDIIPEIKRQGGKNIGGWNYFTEPIAQAKANRLAPMPELTSTGGNHYEQQFTKPTKDERLRAAVMRAAIAGGFAD